MKTQVKYRVTERYYDNGKTTATIRMIYEHESFKEGSFANYDQYESDYSTEKQALKAVKATLKA